jgi:hypothetical protein
VEYNGYKLWSDQIAGAHPTQLVLSAWQRPGFAMCGPAKVCSLADVVATWSPPSARLCCPADFVREVVGGDEKVVLVGNSLGGYNALATAARHPDLVR